jgi:hypothetical protein
MDYDGAQIDLLNAVEVARSAGIPWEDFVALLRELWVKECREEANRIEKIKV